MENPEVPARNQPSFLEKAVANISKFGAVVVSAAGLLSLASMTTYQGSSHTKELFYSTAILGVIYVAACCADHIYSVRRAAAAASSENT